MGRTAWQLVLIGCFLGLAGCTKFFPSDPPNIVWIVIDTLAADRTGFVGGAPTTPRLDGLSKQSLVFTQAISSASWTKPSMVTMFTSLEPHQHGVRHGLSGRGDVLAEELVTIAEVLQVNGYRTLGIQRNPHLQSKMKIDQGFDLYQDRLFSRSPADVLNQEAKQLLKVVEGQPYFLYIHYMDVHLPYRKHDQYSALYGQHEKELAGLRLDQIKELDLSSNDKQYLKALYDGEIRYVDEQIGRLLEELDDNTIIIVTSDHGEEFWEHGGNGHGHSVYDELIRVPLLVSIPGQGHQKIDSQVRLLDIAPTLLDVLGIEAPPQFSGRSLLEEAQDSEDREAWSESTIRGPTKLALRTGDMKGILHVKEGSFEAYDLSKDPLEQHPIEAPLELRKKIHDFLAVEPRQSQEQLLDSRTAERLKALGYIE